MIALFTIGQVGQQDHGPHKHEQGGRYRGDQGEGLHQVGHHINHQRARQQTDAGEDQAIGRYRTARQVLELARRVAIHCQTEQHAAGGEHTAVGRRRCRGQHHEIDDACGCGQTGEHEQLNERAFVSHHITPRGDRQDRNQRKHVEHDDTQRNRVDRPRQVALRVFGLRRSGAHQLDADKGKHGNLETGEKAHQPMGEHAAVIPQVGQRCRIAGG